MKRTPKSRATKSASASASSSRLGVLKTYKLYIGGKFPRTESGRHYPVLAPDGKPLANACLASRKDFREAVVAARAGFKSWSGATAYLRSQILYRIAEMMEGRAAQFISELQQAGSTAADAQREVACAIDRLVYYAGWCDKHQQLFSAVNPVASSHFNFSVPEPMGVVAVLAPERPALLGLISLLAPALAGGNSVIALASTSQPLPAITLGEVLHTSDVPGGVVNLLTGQRGELLEQFAAHMDVNAVVYAGSDAGEITRLRQASVGNLKRVILRDEADWFASASQSPYHVRDTVEIKTTWHPVGV